MPQIKPPGLEPDPSGPSRASLSHRIPAGALFPPGTFLNALREIDSVSVRPSNEPRLSPLWSPRCSRVWHGRQNPAQRTMNGKAPRRPRESKKEAVCLCSHGGMRKCPRSVSNLSEGGQGTFSRRGKASRGRSSHRRARPRLHGPTRGYMEEKGEQRERRKSKGEAWFGEAWIKHLPLSSDPHHLLPPYTPTHKVAVRVRVQVFVKHSSSFTTSFSSPPPPGLSVSAWTGADWGMRVTACTVRLPVWPPHGAQGCVWCSTFLPKTPMPPQHFVGHVDSTALCWQLNPR